MGGKKHNFMMLETKENASTNFNSNAAFLKSNQSKESLCSKQNQSISVKDLGTSFINQGQEFSIELFEKNLRMVREETNRLI